MPLPVTFSTSRHGSPTTFSCCPALCTTVCARTRKALLRIIGVLVQVTSERGTRGSRCPMSMMMSNLLLQRVLLTLVKKRRNKKEDASGNSSLGFFTVTTAAEQSGFLRAFPRRKEALDSCYRHTQTFTVLGTERMRASENRRDDERRWLAGAGVGREGSSS